MERRRAMAEEPLFLQTSMEYLRQKVDTLGVRFQQILGRTPSTKSQYRPTNLEKFNKKHIRSISVVVYLLFVCIFALCAGIYYYRFWKPPKNLPRILTRNITRTILSSDWRIPTCVPWNTIRVILANEKQIPLICNERRWRVMSLWENGRSRTDANRQICLNIWCCS